MIDAAIGSGADIFLTLVVLLISFVAGVMAIDFLKDFNKRPSEKD
jgi:hypothetical protein